MPSAFHITRVENLPAIWDSGFLMCDDAVSAFADHPETFAYEDIKDRRRVTAVPVGPGGVLSNYVPFYFANRSPMLITVFYRDQSNGTRDQDRIIHLKVNVDRIVADGLPFVFTDGHGIMAVTKFYADHVDLPRIDWPVIGSAYWSDTLEQPDRKRRKQAEFLVYKCLPLEYIDEIGVRTAPVRGEVAALLAFREVLPPINLRPEWYYP